MQIDSPRYIANEKILWIQPTGEEVVIVASIGIPHSLDNETWACPAQLEGVDGRYPDMVGGSSLQALGLAMSLVATRISHLLERGEVLVYPCDPTERWDMNSLRNVFGTLTLNEAPTEAL